MISYLEGNILLIRDNSLLVEKNGIGYQIICSSNTIHSQQLNTQVCLFIETFLVQETSFQMFGFITEIEKNLFVEFYKHSSLNKKTIMELLSYPMSSITSAIFSEDIKFFTRITGIGKKTAEALVNEMKNNKYLKTLRSAGGDINANVLDALEALGIESNKAIKMLRDIPDHLSQEEIIKEILLQLQ